MNNSRLVMTLVAVGAVLFSSPAVHARVVDAEAGGPRQRERAEREWAREPRETRDRVEREMRQQEAERREAEARAAEAKKAELARAAKEAAAKAAVVVAKEAVGLATNPVVEGAKIVLGSEEAGPAGLADRPGVTVKEYEERKEFAEAERRTGVLRALENAIREMILGQMVSP